MLYDAHGRRLRRSIGFLRELVVDDDARNVERDLTLADAIGSDWVDDAEEIPDELEL